MESEYDPLDFLQAGSSSLDESFDKAFSILEEAKPSNTQVESYYPLGPLTPEHFKILKYRPQAKPSEGAQDLSKCGPKPISIDKYIKKPKAETVPEPPKKRTCGGRQAQLKKLIRICIELLKICTSKEEIEKYEKLLKKTKNELNRLKKGKKIKN